MLFLLHAMSHNTNKFITLLLPFNFRVDCSTHPPHITALSFMPPTRWKVLDASTYTATCPIYTFPLPSCSLCTASLEMLSLPQTLLHVTHCMGVCLHEHMFCDFFSSPVCVRPVERHQSFLRALQLAFQFAAHKCGGRLWCGCFHRGSLARRK